MKTLLNIEIDNNDYLQLCKCDIIEIKYLYYFDNKKSTLLNNIINNCFVNMKNDNNFVVFFDYDYTYIIYVDKNNKIKIYDIFNNIHCEFKQIQNFDLLFENIIKNMNKLKNMLTFE